MNKLEGCKCVHPHEHSFENLVYSVCILHVPKQCEEGNPCPLFEPQTLMWFGLNMQEKPINRDRTYRIMLRVQTNCQRSPSSSMTFQGITSMRRSKRKHLYFEADWGKKEHRFFDEPTVLFPLTWSLIPSNVLFFPEGSLRLKLIPCFLSHRVYPDSESITVHCIRGIECVGVTGGLQLCMLPA